MQDPIGSFPGLEVVGDLDIDGGAVWQRCKHFLVTAACMSIFVLVGNFSPIAEHLEV
jgi:hypothetical protein